MRSFLLEVRTITSRNLEVRTITSRETSLIGTMRSIREIAHRYYEVIQIGIKSNHVRTLSSRFTQVKRESGSKIGAYDETGSKIGAYVS